MRSSKEFREREKARHKAYRARKRALKDPQEHNTSAPLGYHLKGVSTLLDAEGNVRQTWVKTTRNHVDPEAFISLFRDALATADLPLAARTKAPRDYMPDLLAAYPMGDPHFGMLSWAEETGQDFDLHIAERNLYAAVDNLVTLAPAAEQAVIIQLGDMSHADSAAATTTGGTRVDVDSRWMKVQRVILRTMIRCISRCLEKHKVVRVINEIGNHDTNVSTMLSLCLEAYYHQEPRVVVDTSPSPFHYMEFGKCLLGVTHGHGAKAKDLPGIMAVHQREAWGRTLHRYFYCGHVHHETKKEYPGCIVESFRTLAPKDAWHHGQGYCAGQSMVMDVLHRERGRILRHEVGVESLT